MNRLVGAWGLGLMFFCHSATAQVIEVQSNGFTYQTLTRAGVTLMMTHLPGYLHRYAILQVVVSNGSKAPYTIRPEDFTFERADGKSLRAVPARTVIELLLKKANGNDALKLVTTYEATIFGNTRLSSNSGYDSRRQAAIAYGGNKIRSAALASALALVLTKLPVGDSTDGAVFFPTDGKPLGSGRIVVRAGGEVFQFNAE